MQEQTTRVVHTGETAEQQISRDGSTVVYTAAGFVYSNDAKHDRLGVPTEVLNLYGAVSEPVVEHLAKNARRLGIATCLLGEHGLNRLHFNSLLHLASSQSRAKKSTLNIANEKSASTIATAFAASTCPSLNFA